MKCNENIKTHQRKQFSVDRDSAEKMLNEINEKHRYYGEMEINHLSFFEYRRHKV
jgi:hypothetical protein